MEVTLIKTIAGFVPADPPTVEWANKVKLGQAVHADFKKVRNYAFLRKYFALLNVAFDNWEPGEINSKYGVPEKNFERFREDTTILAGYYHVVIRLDGSTRIVADSISFANMEEETFTKLYSATIDVLLKHVYKSKLSEAELQNIVDQYMSFA